MNAALRLFLVRGLGLRSANLLIKHFKTPDCVFDSKRGELEALGVPTEIADEILSPRCKGGQVGGAPAALDSEDGE